MPASSSDVSMVESSTVWNRFPVVISRK